jgi:3-oxoacyl-[acyl-carrier protein] reductase
MKIKGSKILVTGGSLGIGKETARQLIQKGAQVVITGRNRERIESAAKEIGAIPQVFDMQDTDAIAHNARKSVELLGGLDALVNNAGTGFRRSIEEFTLADFHEVYTTNVFSLALLTQELVKTFKDQNYGNIVNIASTAALKGYPGGSVYSSSKFALRGMTQCWQAELRKYNVRVSLINPSEVTTAFANPDRVERAEEANKLDSGQIAHTIVSTLEMDDKGFIPEVTIWATNPF